jgi:hypothetical protein
LIYVNIISYFDKFVKPFLMSVILTVSPLGRWCIKRIFRLDEVRHMRSPNPRSRTHIDAFGIQLYIRRKRNGFIRLLEVALPLAIEDWVRLRLKRAGERRHAFEQRYGMDFAAFRLAWEEGRVANKHSYEVERDYWEWESAATDEEYLREISESLL